MSDNVELLEESVLRAVDRLKSLTVEKDALREEVDRLKALERAVPGDERGEDDARTWQAVRVQAQSLLRETLSELRGE